MFSPREVDSPQPSMTAAQCGDERAPQPLLGAHWKRRPTSPNPVPVNQNLSVSIKLSQA